MKMAMSILIFCVIVMLCVRHVYGHLTWARAKKIVNECFLWLWECMWSMVVFPGLANSQLWKTTAVLGAFRCVCFRSYGIPQQEPAASLLSHTSTAMEIRSFYGSSDTLRNSIAVVGASARLPQVRPLDTPS
jgi:hypothetical protein